MMRSKNITRYTYERTSFQGWRLCLSRKKCLFVKYFPDRTYESPEAALAAAEKVRQGILDALAADGAVDAAAIKAVFERFR